MWGDGQTFGLGRSLSRSLASSKFKVKKGPEVTRGLRNPIQWSSGLEECGPWID